MVIRHNKKKMRNKIIIIAEAGVNHNGDLQIAKELIDVAANAGADYVKFQTFKACSLVVRSATKADYQKNNDINSTDTQYEMLKKLELPESWHYELKDYSKLKGIKFLSTGFDEQSIDFLEKLDVDLFKIPSGEITNKPFLLHIAKKKKPIIISTGMASMLEIKSALDIFIQEGIKKEQITILHCNTQYPTPFCDVNLLVMNVINKELDVKVGYSDHTLGIEVPIAAVALGAVVIEKHFTLDKEMEGPDHRASLSPSELINMVNGIRNIEVALGETTEKKPTMSEVENIVHARKSIVAKREILKGEIFTPDNITTKRPGNGVSPMEWDNFIGKVSENRYSEDDQIIPQ